MQLLLLLCVVAAATLPQTALAVSATEPTFIDIRNQCVGSQCAKGQWTVSIALGDINRPDQWTQMYPGNATVPLGSCPTPQYGACFKDGSPLGPPMKVMGTSQIRVTYAYHNLTTMVLFNRTTMKPRTLSFKLCYSDAAFAGRPWRKTNKPYPRLTQNCPFEVKDVDVPATLNTSAITAADRQELSGQFVYDVNAQNMPTATLFLMMWVVCTDGLVCAWESMESPFYSVPSQGILVYPPQYGPQYPPPYDVSGPYNGTYIQVQGYNPITPGMTAAAIVLSIFGPVFFICYFIADHISYTKRGKALSW